MADYHYYFSNKYLIIALIPVKDESLDDFKFIVDNYKDKFDKVVLELNSYPVIDEDTIKFINKIIYFFKMYDVTTFISGILPETAYFLSNLEIKINAETYFNLDRIMNDNN